LALTAQQPSKQVRNAVKKAEKVEEHQKKSYAKARKKELKRRNNIQTKEVQDRMKQSRKEANINNKRKKEPFLKRLFRKRRR
jgi:hypothetical protein